ncbi:MAG: hypothetical protein Q4C45_00780 [Oscillospiraceae bacterium]|nr:hypothetical protein [Oscillospiraceae bacterium]
MKHLGKRLICGIFALCLLSTSLCTTVFARSSAYLDSYRATVTPKSGGKMVVTVDVSGVGRMTQIGATTIYIYESSDNESFTKVATYNYEDYPEMMGSGTFYYDDPVTYNGTVGYYYLASVYCYAANASGSDEKNYTTAAKQARAYVPPTT